jgi:ATP-dependent DNA ligase
MALSAAIEALLYRGVAIVIAVVTRIPKQRAVQPARFVEPMQCLAAADLPEGPNWEYEIKFVGYRALGSRAAATRGSCPAMGSLSETLDAPAAEVVAAVRKQGLEGVIAKRRDSLYEPGRRSGVWVKMRIDQDKSWYSAAMFRR